MKKLCDWFDRYRDDELSAEQRVLFERHADACQECRARSAVLSSVLQSLEKQEIGLPRLSPTQIAARAFERQARSWDLTLLSFLRPVHAWSAVAALFIIVALLVGLPWVQQPATNDYEALMSSIEPAQSAQARAAQARSAEALTDGQLELWLELGGSIQ